MGSRKPSIKVGDTAAAVEQLLEVPAGSMCGYLIIGIRNDGDYEINSNTTSREALVALLADAASQLARELAEAIIKRHNN